MAGATHPRPQASDVPPPSKRPSRHPQRGDSGTQNRPNNKISAGNTPIANNSRQSPLPTKAPMSAPRPTPSGITQVTKPPTQPRLEDGMNSCTSGRSTQYSPPTPSPTKKRMTER